MVKFVLILIVTLCGVASASAQHIRSAEQAAYSVDGSSLARQAAEDGIVPVKILSKPHAPYADGSICVSGSVTLRVTFQADGTIGKISVVSGLPYGFNESAMNAARKIKFIPAKRNGMPITRSKVIQYSFGIY